MREPLRARRHEARTEEILDRAVTIAEQDGWAAVTTRRLADEIGYTQPVIYQHFASRAGLIDAIVIRGFHQLTALIEGQTQGGLEAAARTYVTFGRQHPALYEAMFARPVSMPFAAPDTPTAMRSAFTSLETALDPDGALADRESRAELFWASCHGLVSLANTHRIPEAHLDHLITLLVEAAASS